MQVPIVSITVWTADISFKRNVFFGPWAGRITSCDRRSQAAAEGLHPRAAVWGFHLLRAAGAMQPIGGAVAKFVWMSPLAEEEEVTMQ